MSVSIENCLFNDFEIIPEGILKLDITNFNKAPLIYMENRPESLLIIKNSMFKNI